MSKVKWTIVILASIAALTLAIIALYSPWWSEIYHKEDDKMDYGFSWGLDERSEDRAYSENRYKYNCPSCEETFAYSEENLERERDYCPKCGDRVDYGAVKCDVCSATFEKAALLCDECGKLTINPEKEIYRAEGDIMKYIQPLSNTEMIKAEEEDGVMNRVSVSSTVYIIWLLGVFIATLTILAIIISGLYRRLPKLIIISMGIASVLTLGGVVYYSVSWADAYEDDWYDVYGNVEEYRGGYDDDHDGLFIVPDEKDMPVPAVNSFSGYQKHQPEREDSKYIEYSWGPRSGWILGLISSILFTGTTILLFVFRNDLDDDNDDDYEEYEDEEDDDEDEEDEENEYRYKKMEKSKSPKTSKYPPPQPEKKCINCGGVIMDQMAVFCHICGASQSPASPAPVVTPPTAPPVYCDTSPVPIQTKPELSNCSNCNSLNLASADSCMMCGAALKGRVTGPYTSAPVHSMPQRYSYPPPPP